MQLLRPATRETLPSYLSRLAASKGVTTGDLAHDLGGSMKRFLQADEAAVDALARWAQLFATEVEEMLSWTGVPIGNIRLHFRGASVGSRALRKPAVQGCPVCLREDAATNPAEPLSAMVMRGHWQMREVCVCLRHGRSLVTLWTEQELLRRLDFQFQLSAILDSILSSELDGAEIEPTPFDSWLDDRLLGRLDRTWLAPHGAAASAMFCRKFGEGMGGGTASDDPIRKRHWAVAKGFTVVGIGPDEVRTYLLDLARGADTVADPVKTAHGGMIFALESHLRDDPGFDIFRDVLRDAVLDLWPVGAGDHGTREAAGALSAAFRNDRSRRTWHSGAPAEADAGRRWCP